MSNDVCVTEDTLANKVTVIGSGSWGTAITRVLAPRTAEVMVWSHEQEVAQGINESHRNPRQMTGFELPHNVHATTSMAGATRDADMVLVVVPSAFLRSTCALMAPGLDPTTPVLVLTKGIERNTGYLMTEVVEQEIGGPERIAALSGPNHAEEVAEGKVSAAVLASTNPELCKTFQDLLVRPEFRVYVSEDVRGVEVCAAEKNVIALACGIAAASGAGDNTLAALMTRGLAEISRLAVALGGDPLTCMGLAGMGDLVVTCTSRHSRNRTFGEAFVAGESLDDYQQRTGMVVEGAEAAASISDLARKCGIVVPITDAVYGILYEGISLQEAIEALLGRLPNEEFYGVAPGAKPGANTTFFG